MEQFSIPITINNKINPLIVKANNFLISKYKDRIKSSNTSQDKSLLLEQLWSKEFHASISITNNSNNLTTVCFDNHKHYIFFMLMWS